jgi:mannitol-1-phosphate/altronate dehydrogenase
MYLSQIVFDDYTCYYTYWYCWAKEVSGIEDQYPVVCESFQQWVIEDEFIAGRPNLESVGVQFVKNVAPFEKMKWAY